MSERTSYVPGTPCWVDLGTPDIDGAASFYGDLFGWSIPEGENSEQTGGYRQAMLRDKPVAGVMPLMQEGQPPAWSNYVAVEDADATAAKVREAGGMVMAEPMDVMDLGRMAIFADTDRRSLRRLAAGHLHRRPGRQRGRRRGLERAQHPRHRGGQGLLRRSLRLELRASASSRPACTPASKSARTRSAA